MKTESQLKALFSEAYSDAVAAGLPVPKQNEIAVYYNEHIGRAWGSCRKFRGGYTIIQLSDRLCQHTSDNSILNTIIHELCHASGASGHMGLFRHFVAQINNRFPNKYNIKRCSSINEKMKQTEIESIYKYIVKCPTCGHTWGYNRANKVVRNPELYHCEACKKKHSNDKALWTIVRAK